jgi:tRNA G18 (ribose-2'-O)-methylase SpoU
VFERITSINDPRVADYRGVSEPHLLKTRQLFIAEGRSIVARLIEEGDWAIRSVLVNESARRDLEPTLAAAADRVPVFVCAAADFLGITGHDIHRGCLALVERPPSRLLSAAMVSSRLAVVLEGVGNADNIGGVFRNAAAFGADLVVLSPGCCSPLYRKAIRTSMGATLRVPFVHLDDDWPDALMVMRTAGFVLAALTPREPAEPVDEFARRPMPPRLALIVGAEGPGLTPSIESSADHRLRIPIAPGVDSLNLAVATGIALEQVARNMRGRGILAAPKGTQT